MPLSLDAALRSDFIGLDTCYPRADGGCSRRVYLDSAASRWHRAVPGSWLTRCCALYATHSSVHFSARIASAPDWARAQMLDFVHADPERAHRALHWQWLHGTPEPSRAQSGRI